MIDKTEAWVFHVLGDDTGASAVWVAQRLEPDHVSDTALYVCCCVFLCNVSHMASKEKLAMVAVQQMSI